MVWTISLVCCASLGHFRWVGRDGLDYGSIEFLRAAALMASYLEFPNRERVQATRGACASHVPAMNADVMRAASVACAGLIGSGQTYEVRRARKKRREWWGQTMPRRSLCLLNPLLKLKSPETHLRFTVSKHSPYTRRRAQF